MNKITILLMMILTLTTCSCSYKEGKDMKVGETSGSFTSTTIIIKDTLNNVYELNIDRNDFTYLKKIKGKH